MHRRNDGRMRLAPKRRRAGDDPLDAGSFGGDHAHVRRGDHGIAAAGHVAAHTIDRNILVAKHHAGKRLHLHILECGALRQREIADLGLRELDVVDYPLRQRAYALGDFTLGEPE